MDNAFGILFIWSLLGHKNLMGFLSDIADLSCVDVVVAYELVLCFINTYLVMTKFLLQ